MTDSLWNWTLSDFRAQTASVRATPGGGSVCAVSASFGLGLVIMALEITQKREQRTAFSAAISDARGILRELSESADDDVRAFEGDMLATKLPQVTGEQRQARELALRRAADVATDVPLAAARRAVRALALAADAAETASSHVISDVQAGAELLHASVLGLVATLAMNLNAIGDEARQRAITERDALTATAQQALAQVRSRTSERGSART